MGLAISRRGHSIQSLNKLLGSEPCQIGGTLTQAKISPASAERTLGCDRPGCPVALPTNLTEPAQRREDLRLLSAERPKPRSGEGCRTPAADRATRHGRRRRCHCSVQFCQDAFCRPLCRFRSSSVFARPWKPIRCPTASDSSSPIFEYVARWPGIRCSNSHRLRQSYPQCPRCRCRRADSSPSARRRIAGSRFCSSPDPRGHRSEHLVMEPLYSTSGAAWGWIGSCSRHLRRRQLRVTSVPQAWRRCIRSRQTTRNRCAHQLQLRRHAPFNLFCCREPTQLKSNSGALLRFCRR